MFSDIKHPPNLSPARWRSGQAPFNSLLSCEIAPTSEHRPPPSCGACRPFDFIRGYIFSYVKLLGLESVVNSLLAPGARGCASLCQLRRGLALLGAAIKHAGCADNEAAVNFLADAGSEETRFRRRRRELACAILVLWQTAILNSDRFSAEPGRCLRMGRISAARSSRPCAVRRGASARAEVIAPNLRPQGYRTGTRVIFTKADRERANLLVRCATRAARRRRLSLSARRCRDAH